MHQTLCRTKLFCDCHNTIADERYCDSDLAGFYRCGDDDTTRPNDVRFIEESKVCDGRGDCVDGEDEIWIQGDSEREGKCRFGLTCFNKNNVQVRIFNTKLLIL